MWVWAGYALKKGFPWLGFSSTLVTVWYGSWMVLISPTSVSPSLIQLHASLLSFDLQSVEVMNTSNIVFLVLKAMF